MKKIYILFLFSMMLSFSVSAQVIILQPDAVSGIDTYVSSVNDSDNYGTDPYLYMGGGAWQNDTFNLYLKFDLTSVIPGTIIDSARIDLYEIGQNGNMAGYNYGAFEVTGPWTEDTLYWYNQPQYDTAMLYGFTGGYFQWTGGPGWRSVYIPDTVVQNWLDNPSSNYGIVIKALAGFYGFPYITSSDWTNAEYHPRLVINSNGATISGTVTDASTSNPLEGIILNAYDISNTLLIAADTSDASGNYELDLLYPDTFIIRVNAITGYLPALFDSIVVAEGQNYDLDPELTPNANAVAGVQCGTWSLANSPYIITGNVIVPDTCQLSIEPGVVVQYAGPFGLCVYGSLEATGTESDSIIFTNYDTLPNNKGRGLRFYFSDSSIVEYCRVENMYSYDNIWGRLEYDEGGGIYSYNSNLVIQHSCIRRNFAQSGAGMFILSYNNAVSYINRNKIEDNTAQYYGNSDDGAGGIYIYASDLYESIFLNENLFLGNKFIDPNIGNVEGGGALRTVGGGYRIINNTFFNNSAFRGPAIYAIGFDGKILNNIFWSNTGSLYNEQVAINDVTFAPGFEASYNCVQDSGIIKWTNTEVSDSVPGVGNIYVYPEFADTLSGHYWLASNSPCIDTGYNHFLYSQFDYLDRCRIFDGDANGSGIVDIGAYEYNASSFPYLDLGPDYSVCFDSANIISAAQFYDHYSWNNGDTTYLTHVLNTDSFYVTVSNIQGCYAFDSITVTVNPLPDVHLPADTAFCGENILIDAGTGYNSYLWNDSVNTQINDVTVSGEYFVFVTDPFGCSNYSDTMNVEIFSIPEIVLPDTTIPLSNGSVVLDAGLGYSSYNWSNGETTHLIVIFANYFGTGTHYVYVTVTTSDGCVGTGVSVITVYDDTGINEIDNANISLYPNPAETSITLNGINTSDIVNVQVSDETGRVIMNQIYETTGKNNSINVSELSPGVYCVKIRSDFGIRVIKFIKQ